MEVTQVVNRTRGRAMAVATEEINDDSVVVKRRKVGNEEFRSPSSTLVQTKPLDREINVNSAAEEDPRDSCDATASVGSGGVIPAGCCSSTGSMENLKGVDLEENFETDAAERSYDLDRCESAPTSESKAESGEMDSSTMKQSSATINTCHTILSSEKMPPEEELDAFFASTQEDLNKRFKDKYNYDIVNDIPLKGRYEWIQITPRK